MLGAVDAQLRPRERHAEQLASAAVGVDFDVYIGADRKERLHVDLVVGVIVTDEVTVAEPANGLDLPRLPSNDYRLYPVVDQIADKVCATMANYSGRPSSREKDLVDLVVFAKTQTVDGDALRRAIRAEARVRSLRPFTELTIPPNWGTRVLEGGEGRSLLCRPPDGRTRERAHAHVHRPGAPRRSIRAHVVTGIARLDLIAHPIPGGSFVLTRHRDASGRSRPRSRSKAANPAHPLTLGRQRA